MGAESPFIFKQETSYCPGRVKKNPCAQNSMVSGAWILKEEVVLAQCVKGRRKDGTGEPRPFLLCLCPLQPQLLKSNQTLFVIQDYKHVF